MNSELHHIVRLLYVRRVLVAWIVGLGCVVGVMVSFFLPVQYQSSAALRSEDTPVMDDMLKDMLSTLPFSIDVQKRDSTKDIVAFLESRTLRQRLIDGLDLLPRLYPWHYHPVFSALLHVSVPTTALALQEEALDAVFTVMEEADGLIRLRYLDRDPRFAAGVLDRVIVELRLYLDTEHETDAKRERIFIEKRLAESEAELHRWEAMTPSAQMPLSRIHRELAANQSVYTELKRRFALAQIAEARQTVAFKVLDPPLIPVKRARPRRMLIVGFFVVVSALIACIVVLGLAARDTTRRNDFAVPDDNETP